MRLIDADEFIKRMRKWMPKDPCGKEQTIEEVVATDIAVSVCMEIEETPTAFDKEKVIEELNERSDYARNRWLNQTKEGYSKYWDGKENGLREAIEIVKKGGIE